MNGAERESARDASAVAPDKRTPERSLANDYGRKRIGLALSDEIGLTAQPLATFFRKNRREDIRYLRNICRKHSVTRILVGHPVQMNGDRGAMADEVAQYAARLSKELRIAVELVDERLSSWEANETAKLAGFSSRRKRQPMDHVAAAIFLREYLDRRQKQAEAYQAGEG